MSSDLIVQFDSIEGLTLFPDERGTVTLTVTNQGDRQVNGPITLDLFASTDAFLDRTPLNVIDDELGRVTNDERLEGTDELLGRVTNFAFNLAPGESTTLPLDFAQLEELRNPSVVSPGGYYLIAQIDSNNIVVESNEFNNVTRPNTPSVPPPAFVSTEGTDVVLDWNSTFLNAVQFIATRPITSPPFMAHDAAILHTAIFDAVNAFEDSYASYLVNDIDPPQGASIEAAAVGAAYETLTRLYSPERFLPLLEPLEVDSVEGQLPVGQFPGGELPELSVETQINARAGFSLLTNEINRSSTEQFPELEERFPGLVERLRVVRAEFDEQLNRSLLEITDDQAAIDTGKAFGIEVANRILQDREEDGALEAARTDGVFTPSRGLGDWRPTPPDFVPALLPDWGQVTPFGERSVEELREAAELFGPPPFGSERYLNDLNEVLAFGERNSTVRTEDQTIDRTSQTTSALFWAYDRPDTFRPPGQWNEIAQEVALDQPNRSLVDNARLFALLNIAQADAGIVTWNAKYEFEQLRPITAIRQTTDPDWTPLLDTPPFPDYISGHAAFGGAAGQVLSYTFGENTSFSIPSQELPGVFRSYDNFDAAIRDNANSRIYGGVHVRSSAVTDILRPFADFGVTDDIGVALGRTVATSLLGDTLQTM